MNRSLLLKSEIQMFINRDFKHLKWEKETHKEICLTDFSSSSKRAQCVSLQILRQWTAAVTTRRAAEWVISRSVLFVTLLWLCSAQVRMNTRHRCWVPRWTVLVIQNLCPNSPHAGACTCFRQSESPRSGCDFSNQSYSWWVGLPSNMRE